MKKNWRLTEKESKNQRLNSRESFPRPKKTSLMIMIQLQKIKQKPFFPEEINKGCLSLTLKNKNTNLIKRTDFSTTGMEKKKNWNERSDERKKERREKLTGYWHGEYQLQAVSRSPWKTFPWKLCTSLSQTRLKILNPTPKPKPTTNFHAFSLSTEL